MRKWVFWRRVLAVFVVVSGLLTASLHAQLSQTLLDRAKADLERIKALVDQGTLPRASLDQAKERLADAQDEETLSETLYSPARVQDTTSAQADDMVAAATRRVERASVRVEERHKLLDMGIISQAEMAGVKSDLYSRELVLDLARTRVKMLDDLRQMASEEQHLELATVQNSMIRYNGSAAFKLTDLPEIEKDFKSQFHRDLPVSAVGQTLVHQSLGLDHRNKVDVALNPEQPEGLWLRKYLEKQHMPYLAFRRAVAGAATAAHIHIGTESSRLSFPAR